MSTASVGSRRGSTEELEMLACGESSSHPRMQALDDVVIDASQEESDVVRLSVDTQDRASSFKPTVPPPPETAGRNRFADGLRSPSTAKNPMRQRRFSIAARETVAGTLAKENKAFAAAFDLGDTSSRSPRILEPEKSESQKKMSGPFLWDRLRAGCVGPGTCFVLLIIVANGLAFCACQWYAQTRVWPDDPKEEEVSYQCSLLLV